MSGSGESSNDTESEGKNSNGFNGVIQQELDQLGKGKETPGLGDT